MHSYTHLTPTTFLERAGCTFPEREAVIHSGGSTSYGELLQRTRALAHVLIGLGVKYGDRIALLSENNLQIIEAHFAIPAVGAVIVTLNPWLPSKAIADLLEFCEAKILIVNNDLLKLNRDIFTKQGKLKYIISLGSDVDIDVAENAPPIVNYEEAISKKNNNIVLDQAIRSELDPIAINFTSGTTGFPKGVVFSHRAAYLHAIGQILMLELKSSSRYLWTLPMFHVNGWGHMWAAVTVGATQIVIPKTTNTEFDFIGHIKKQSITHLSGAPRLVRSLVESSEAGATFQNLTIVTGGAAPSPLLITQLEKMGIRFIHQYGLNETCGPYVVCEEQDGWKHLSLDARTKKRMRQGVATIHAGTGLRVVDTNMNDVPTDGNTLGEIIMSGNTVATEYYNNAEATQKAFFSGWFHSGDMAVVHSDRYIEIKDRIKDLIYVETEYGWENISSIEVENTISQHTGINDVAVIGLSCNEGTLLIAFLEKSHNSELSEEDLHQYCSQELAEYKRPHYFFFSELPKTATGKVRKNLLVKDANTRISSLSKT